MDEFKCQGRKQQGRHWQAASWRLEHLEDGLERALLTCNSQHTRPLQNREAKASLPNSIL